MRKFIQLFLVLVATVCFLLMAFYEHKYSKLNMVINLMHWPDTFKSTPPVPVKHCQWNDDDASDDLHWTEAAPDLFIYSAFLMRNRSTVQIISLSHSKGDKQRIACSFMHEGSPIMSKGYVRSSTIGQIGGWTFNLLSCLLNKDKTHLPLNGLAVSGPDAAVERTFAVIDKSPNTSSTQKNVVVACVKPLSPGFSDTPRLVEFLTLMRLAGVTRTVIYHRGLDRSARLFLNYERKKGTVQVFPFAVPLKTPAELSDSAAFLDCFMRSSLTNSTVIKIDLDDIFSVEDSEKIQSSLPPGFSGLVTFKTRLFCAEFPDDIVARTLKFPFITLRKTKRLKQESLSSVLVLEARDNVTSLNKAKSALDPNRLSSLPSVRALFFDSVVLNHYARCTSKKAFKGMVSDPFMMKHKSLLFKELRPYIQF